MTKYNLSEKNHILKGESSVSLYASADKTGWAFVCMFHFFLSSTSKIKFRQGQMPVFFARDGETGPATYWCTIYDDNILRPSQSGGTRGSGTPDLI